MNILSIDPGINTGWAFWFGRKLYSVGVITEPKRNSKMSHSDRICKMVESVAKNLSEVELYQSSLVVMEGTAFWEKSYKSKTAAITGSLQFLSMLIGAYIYYFFSEGIQTKLILPSQWKGQMSDKLVQARSSMVTKKIVNNIHTCCAIGIGAHYLGYKEFNHAK